MKIWIDILTPKQVLFLGCLIDDLKARGHQVLGTSRDYREVKPMAEGVGLQLSYVGRHGGASLDGKLRAYAERVLALEDAVKKWSPDIAVSFGSPDCARVAFGLGISHVSVNDSPHSESVAKLTLPLSRTLLTPWIIPSRVWTKFGISARRIVKYRALDPAGWLKRASTWKGGNLSLDEDMRTVTVRVEETHASYLYGLDPMRTAEMLRSLASSLRGYNLVLLCRYQDQIDELSRLLEPPFIIPRSIVEGRSLLESSDLFIGFGGTMTAEAALLGVPTISAYPGSRTIVEDFLATRGLVFRVRSIKTLHSEARRLLRDKALRSELRKRGKSLLDSMEDPIVKIAETVEGNVNL